MWMDSHSSFFVLGFRMCVWYLHFSFVKFPLSHYAQYSCDDREFCHYIHVCSSQSSVAKLAVQYTHKHWLYDHNMHIAQYTLNKMKQNSIAFISKHSLQNTVHFSFTQPIDMRWKLWTAFVSSFEQVERGLLECFHYSEWRKGSQCKRLHAIHEHMMLLSYSVLFKVSVFGSTDLLQAPYPALFHEVIY